VQGTYAKVKYGQHAETGEAVAIKASEVECLGLLCSSVFSAGAISPAPNIGSLHKARQMGILIECFVLQRLILPLHRFWTRSSSSAAA